MRTALALATVLVLPTGVAAPLAGAVPDSEETERSSPNRAAGHIHFRLEARPGASITLELNAALAPSAGGSATLGDGWLERYDVDAAVHELNCNWIAGLRDYPSARHWKAYGASLARVFYDYLGAVAP